MKFIHAADIHLDSPLRGLERYEGAPVDQLRGATRRALENLVAMCLAEQVQFLLIAGDIYDGDWVDYSTGMFFARQMSILREAQIPVFIIRGNHDAASQITLHLRLPDNVHQFATTAPETVLLENLGVAIHGQGFATRAVQEDLSSRYPLAQKGFFNIGLLHTSADGREGHENYAPCSVGGLASRGYDYWALGHVHGREILSQDPWVVFPGNVQGRQLRESGSKGCTLITVQEGRVDTVEHRALDVVRWQRCIVSAQGAADIDQLLSRARLLLAKELEAADERLLAVRLIVCGECPGYRSTTETDAQLMSECQALANDVGAGRIWLERTVVQLRQPLNLEQIAQRQDPLGDLLRFIRTLPEDGNSLNELLKHFKPLQQKLPVELRQEDDALILDDPRTVIELLPEIEQLLLPRLLAIEGDI